MWEEFLSPFYGRDAVTVLPVILHPKSRGSIRLRSANPFDHPSIDPKYFSHPDDLRGVHLIQHFLLDGLFLEKLPNFVMLHSNNTWHSRGRAMKVDKFLLFENTACNAF